MLELMALIFSVFSTMHHLYRNIYSGDMLKYWFPTSFEKESALNKIIKTTLVNLVVHNFFLKCSLRNLLYIYIHIHTTHMHTYF